MKRGMITALFVIAIILSASYFVYALESGDSSSFIVQGGGNNTCTAGWKCKNVNKLGYQNADCSWDSGLIDCPHSCLNGACQNQTCTAGWKCKDSETKAYQNTDCSWSSISACQYGCSNGACLCKATKTCTDSSTLHEVSLTCDTKDTLCPNGCKDGACQPRCYTVVVGQDCYKTCKRFLFWRRSCRTECVPRLGTRCE